MVKPCQSRPRGILRDRASSPFPKRLRRRGHTACPFLREDEVDWRRPGGMATLNSVTGAQERTRSNDGPVVRDGSQRTRCELTLGELQARLLLVETAPGDAFGARHDLQPLAGGVVERECRRAGPGVERQPKTVFRTKLKSRCTRTVRRNR